MRRGIWVSALLAAAAGVQAGLIDYTFSGTVTSFSDETGTYSGSIQVGDTFTFSAVLDTAASPSQITSWAASYSLVGPTNITIGSFTHQVTGDAASRPFGAFLESEGPYPDPYSYTFGGQESKGHFTMADGMPASLGEMDDTAFLYDYTNSAFSSLGVPGSINMNSFGQRGLLFTNSVFDYETDVTNSDGAIVSTPYYKTDSVVASLDSVTVAAVPEPSSLFTLGLPLLLFGWNRRRYACRGRAR